MDIYLVGKAGSGKTVCADYLINKFGYMRSKFAYPVYMIAEKYFGMTDKDRKLLQFIGTEAGRELFDEQIWIDHFQEYISIARYTAKKLFNRDMDFVSDDVRFPNEHDFLSKYGWTGIYLDVPEDERLKRLEGRDGDAQAQHLNHSSETSIDLFKDKLVKIDASGSLEDTLENLEAKLEELQNENEERSS